MQDNGRSYTTRWRVRVYEVDVNGHVNNAVYLNYAEQVATEHATAAGFGGEWTRAAGGAWVVRRHQIVYRRPAREGDELELRTFVTAMTGARAKRETTIRRVADDVLIAEIETEWVWLRMPEGRPSRIPEAVARAMAMFDPSSGSAENTD
jgi:acyl-CoA thioester hydrolase